jgi:pimeloyl-ACP methyl ester carboxylesterase
VTVDLGHPEADRVIALADGRVMTVREYGDPAGTPVIALHGTPASRLMYSAARSAGGFGLRLIAPDRWGYGETSAHPNPTLPAFAADIAHLADALAIDRFAVLGVSGGGPYAAALGVLLRERVTALALVAPVGPIADVPGGVSLSAFHQFCFRILPRVPGPLRLVFTAFRRGLKSSPDAAIRVATMRSPPPDITVLANPEVHARFAAMFAEGLKAGVAGALIDMQIFSRPWQMPLDHIVAPCALWIGTADNNVPIAAAYKLAASIPGCELIELAGEGHLWVALNYDGVLGWIAAKQKGAVPAAPSS